MSNFDEPTWNAAGSGPDDPPASGPDPRAVPPTAPQPAWGQPTGEQPLWPTWPPTAPQPTQPNTGWGWGAAAPQQPASWPPPQPHEASTAKSKRIAAIVAAVALVLASAGIGAIVAVAVRGNNNAQQNASSQFPNFPNFPFTPGNGNTGGSSNNGSNGGLGVGNGGSSNNGSSNSGSGSLNSNDIASKVTPAIVDINTTLGQTGRAAGTGMVISSDGFILTNNHVIADATSIKVTIGGTGPTYDGKVIGYDVADDVALVKINASNLKTITIGDPSTVHQGDPVVAIGNALGKGGSPAVTQGKVTALNQDVTAGDPGGVSETLHGMIQIDAPIQPGDSGGALVNANAQVIGMNTAAAGGQFTVQSGSNIGFAIPLNNAVQITNQIQAGNETDKIHIGDRALLGVEVRDAGSQSQFGDNNSNTAPVDSGALVVGVADNSAAGDAGIEVGDVIVKVDGQTIDGQNALHLALVKYHPGDKATIEWVDTSGNHHTASVPLKLGPPA
jgi:S1-C subfamily serine protease